MTEETDSTTTTSETISTSWHTYPKSHAIGHRAISSLFLDPVTIEEKVDGSQFSFGVFGGELKCRSKGAQLNIMAPDKMFAKGVEVAKELHEAGLLRDGWTYRGEYLQRPKHNTLAYDRIPAKHIIGFDINDGHESYLSYEAKAAEFARLGLETVPLIHYGIVDAASDLRAMLDRVSVLGGQKIEGIVVKNYLKFQADGKVVMGKFVSEAFKEVHTKDWKERHPGKGDIVQQLVEQYRTPARWAKAVQHLSEAGKIQGAPQDIPAIFAEVNRDVLDECGPDIKEFLFEHFWKDISRGITFGLAQWYKDELLKASFEAEPAVAPAVNEEQEPTTPLVA